MSDLTFMPAAEIAALIQHGKASATEAVDAYLAQIQRHNGLLNAIVTLEGMTSPYFSQKKTAVAHVVAQRLCSVRRACRYLGLPRSTYRYVPKPVPDRRHQLHQRMVALSWAHPRYGYRRIRQGTGERGLDGKP